MGGLWEGGSGGGVRAWGRGGVGEGDCLSLNSFFYE